MKIHALASTRQYARHLRAIWKHIDPSLQGQFITARGANTKGLPPDDVVMVAGFYDIAPVPQRIVYVEHGAGQAYAGDPVAAGHPCYHGSVHAERVIGYVSPSQRVADSWGRPAFAAGCPALDDIPQRQIRHALNRVAAFTFHFDARGACVAPEARSAREHYIDMLHNMVDSLRSSGYEVIGTWHPRDPMGEGIWRYLQVEPVADPDEVLARAHLLVADNTSLMYEAAHLGIPVAVLNAPWYREDVHHGLRFWDHLPGKPVNSPEEFVSVNWRSHTNELAVYAIARSAADYAYACRPGRAGEAAARWVEKLAQGEV